MHMPKRLSSIFLQTQPVREIVVLDDCSSDNSLSVIPAVAAEWGRQVRLLPNSVNSGSVFKQWRKAAETTAGEFLWIAEADDLCAPKFLAEVVALMRHDPSVRFAFSDSAAIDADGAPLWPSYKSYYAGVAPDALSRTGIFEAEDFVQRFLSVKNLILNVSAVIWRRKALLAAMDACEADLQTYKMAGDWRLYLQALSGSGARVAYCAEALNTHRRHAASVTHALNADKHVAEIAACHTFAKSAFALGPDVEKSQATYLREVSAQLGATTYTEPEDDLDAECAAAPLANLLKRAS
jgi:glycosyltransferase involved in cell wall biosynthesis